MTRRLDFNIFSLGATALAITVFVSLFAGITTNNSTPSEIPYSRNLEKSSSGSYLNLLVAESEETTSLKIHTDNYEISDSPQSILQPEAQSTSPESPTPSRSSATVQPSVSATPEPTEAPTDETPAEEPASTESDLDALIAEFKARDEKISALLDELNSALDQLYPEKIIYQPELDALYPTLSELSELITLESDFITAHSDDLPDFYHKRHESNLSAFSALRDRLDYLLDNLQPLSEDINTYTYASLCESLSSSEPEPSPSITDTPEESSESSTEPTLDTFGFSICSDASYVAEKASEFYSLSLSDWGDPIDWRESTLALGFTVDDSPSAHSIGIDLSGTSPHVIWVESLASSPSPTASVSPISATPSPVPTSDPTPSLLINLSEYDSLLAPLDFSYRTNVPASSYIFIHLDSLPASSEISPDSDSSISI